jgi:transposase
VSHIKKGDTTRQVEHIGRDSAKPRLQVHGVDAHGKVVTRKQLTRGKGIGYFAQLPPCLVGLEAWGRAPDWARERQKLGQDARLLAVSYIWP